MSTHAYSHNESNGITTTTCSCGWKTTATGPNADTIGKIAAIEHEFVDNPNKGSIEVRLERAERIISILGEVLKAKI